LGALSHEGGEVRHIAGGGDMAGEGTDVVRQSGGVEAEQCLAPAFAKVVLGGLQQAESSLGLGHLELEAGVGELDQAREKIAFLRVGGGGKPYRFPHLMRLPEEAVSIEAKAVSVSRCVVPGLLIDPRRRQRLDGVEGAAIGRRAGRRDVPATGKPECHLQCFAALCSHLSRPLPAATSGRSRDVFMAPPMGSWRHEFVHRIVTADGLRGRFQRRLFSGVLSTVFIGNFCNCVRPGICARNA
jgi:hypothetical protein